MDPVGSWSAYAASYNRLASAGGFQNAPGGGEFHHPLVGGGPPSGGGPMGSSGLLAGTAPSPFNPPGFLSPSPVPVAYDPVFTPLFHQKAHYGMQHRPSLKQPEPSELYSQMTPNTYFEQNNPPSLTWSQNNAQLPSPFGILPHESVVPSSPGVPPKPYENFNAHFAAAQTLNQLNSQLSDYRNSSFVDPKKRSLSPPGKTMNSTSFFQQMYNPNEPSHFKQADYQMKPFQNGQIQQSCIIPSPSQQGREYRIPQPPRLPCASQPIEKPNNFTPPKQSIVLKPLVKSYDSEKRAELDSQSSPISFAMIDGQRNFQNSKLRPTQQFQPIPSQQNYRYPMTPESDYQRSKSTESFGSSSSNPDCGLGLPRRPSPLQAHTSPSGAAPSPVYPLYNSPLTTISSPSPVQHEACFNKQPELTPPLDVTLPRSSVAYSVITRTDTRYDRQDYVKQQWDDRQRRYTGYDVQNGQNRQQYFETGHQVTLQDLSSCRGDPMSLVKTLQQQQPEKSPDDKTKNRKCNEKTQEGDYFSRIPPPAHHNTNQTSQNGYFDFERWNLPPPPGKVFSSSPVAFGAQPSITTNFGNPQHQPLVMPHPGPPLPYFPTFQISNPPTSDTTQTVEVPKEQPKVIVPNIEEELRCLLDENIVNEIQTPRKIIAPNRRTNFMSSFIKFLQGDKESSPPPDSKPVRPVLKTKIYPLLNCTKEKEVPVKIPEFPSDPQDDPRYFPLPKSSDKRKFDSSDSDFTDDDFGFGPKLEKKVETTPPPPPPTPPPPCQSKVDKTTAKSKKKPKAQPKNNMKKTKPKDDELQEVVVTRREVSKRKAKDKLVNLTEEVDENHIPELNDSDSDPPWLPLPNGDDGNEDETLNKSRRRLFAKRKVVLKKEVTSDEDDAPLSERAKKKVKRKPQPNGKSKISKEKYQNKPLLHVITARKLSTHHSSKSQHFPFNVGDFVVLKSDLHLRHPPLWRVKEKTMVQKFQHFVKNGVSLYNNLPYYTGWSSESKNVYEGVTVRVVTMTKHDMVVQLLTTNLQIIDSGRDVIEASMKETMKYQDNFEVYVQTLFSQALDSNFLVEIFLEKDDYFLSNVRGVDWVVSQLKSRLSTALGWSDKLTGALDRHPSYRVTLRTGGVCAPCGRPAQLQATLSGALYHPDTLRPSGDPPTTLEAILCRDCFLYLEVLHKLCHFKCALYGVCEERVNEKRALDTEKDTTIVLNELLADDVWLNQLFRTIRSEWGYTEKLIDSLKKRQTAQNSS